MNAVLEAIHNRRSIRQFEQRPVEAESLEEVLEAGRGAPSGSNSRSSHLIVIENQGILEELRELVKTQFSQMEADENTYVSIRNAVANSMKGDYCYDYHAPVLIVTANQMGYGNAMADCSCVLSNMMLAAQALGAGSCWINQLRWLDGNPAVRARMMELGLGENETICGALALGYPAHEPGKRGPAALEGNPVTYVR